MTDGATGDGPKYQRIAGDLRARIASGEYPVGSKIPTNRALVERYEASLVTVAAALEVLRKDGVIKSAQGSGTFVISLPGPREAQPDLADLTRRVEALERHREANDVDLVGLYAKLALDQPSHQQDNGGRTRDERAG